MGQPAQPGTAIDGGAIIVAFAQIGLAGVQRHPHPQRRRRRPWLGGQRLLDCDGRDHRIGGMIEDRETAIALAARAYQHAGVMCHDRLDQKIVAREGAPSFVGQAQINPNDVDFIGFRFRSALVFEDGFEGGSTAQW